MSLIKSLDEIKKIELAGKILSSVLKQVAGAALEGTSLLFLDALARKLIREAGTEPSFLGYQPHGAERPYPAVICASLNEVVVHGVPTDRKLKSGDILTIDLGVRYDGWNADAAVTVSIGEVSAKAKKLIDVTRRALALGIQAVKPGKHLGDIGAAIQSYVAKHGFSVVKGLTGHGIGRELHEEPSVLNEGKRGEGLLLKPGMALAIEPMVAAGRGDIIQLDDDGYATADGSMSAHFEHTIILTERGAKTVTA